MKTYNIPDGIANIKSLFPEIDFSEINEWNIHVKDTEGNIIAEGRQNKISKCCGDGKVRIHFVNSCGMIDSLNFVKSARTHSAKSQLWRRPKLYNDDITLGGGYRRDITSNEITEAETCTDIESSQRWIRDLLDTPMAWVEAYQPKGFTDREERAFIPIVIKDLSHVEMKDTERYYYKIRISFEKSNDNITFR